MKCSWSIEWCMCGPVVAWYCWLCGEYSLKLVELGTWEVYDKRPWRLTDLSGQSHSSGMTNSQFEIRRAPGEMNTRGTILQWLGNSWGLKLFQHIKYKHPVLFSIRGDGPPMLGRPSRVQCYVIVVGEMIRFPSMVSDINSRVREASDCNLFLVFNSRRLLCILLSIYAEDGIIVLGIHWYN